tara:strand:- start:4296 stop:4736 length:441 start_codon:yes stop_codon:yes gene_type:complete
MDSKKIGQQLNNHMFGKTGRKVNNERTKRAVGDLDNMVKIHSIVNHEVGIPQDVDTKIALHSIEEQGMSAIGSLLDQSVLPEVLDTERGSNNTATYDHIKWENSEIKQKVKEWKFCPVCGTRLLSPRLKRNLKTCSKACTDILMNE